MKKVEFYQPKQTVGEFEKILECVWDGETMEIEGSAEWLKQILEEEGVEGHFPEEGEVFLDQLTERFKNIYLLATGILEADD